MLLPRNKLFKSSMMLPKPCILACKITLIKTLPQVEIHVFVQRELVELAKNSLTTSFISFMPLRLT